MRVPLYIVGALVIIAASFYGTLFAIDRYALLSDFPYPDSVRAAHVASIKEALEKYRAKRGTYPPSDNAPVASLKAVLVDGGYLKAIPQDPVVPDNYYYTSGGTNYALLVRQLKYAAGKVPAGAQCMTGVGIAGTGWWGQPPECPF